MQFCSPDTDSLADVSATARTAVLPLFLAHWKPLAERALSGRGQDDSRPPDLLPIEGNRHQLVPILPLYAHCRPDPASRRLIFLPTLLALTTQHPGGTVPLIMSAYFFHSREPFSNIVEFTDDFKGGLTSCDRAVTANPTLRVARMASMTVRA